MSIYDIKISLLIDASIRLMFDPAAQTAAKMQEREQRLIGLIGPDEYEIIKKEYPAAWLLDDNKFNSIMHICSIHTADEAIDIMKRSIGPSQ